MVSKNDRPGSSEPSAAISALAPGGIRAVAAVGHPDAINLLFGEPDFVTPEHIARAGIEAIERHQTSYAPGRGIAPLREAVARRMTARTGTATSLDNVTITAGGVQALLGALYAVAERGDCVLVPDPGWPNYVGQCALLGLTAIRYPLRVGNAFQPDLDELGATISTLAAGTRAVAIILNSPNNPTGAVWTPAHVTGVVELAQRHGLWVISDEVYDEIVFEGLHLPAATVDAERTLTISSFSKTYAMTGWRVGYLTAPPIIGTLVGKVLELEASCVSTPSQNAALAALLGPQECIAAMREALRVTSRPRRRSTEGEKPLHDDAIRCLLRARRRFRRDDRHRCAGAAACSSA